MPKTTPNFDIVARISFGEHGISTHVLPLKLVQHQDGTTVAITTNEWRKMLPPLLVQHEGQWYLGNVQVNLVETKASKTKRGQSLRLVDTGK